MSIAIVAIIAAVAWGAGFGSGWMVDTWKQGAAHAKELQAAQKSRDVAQAKLDEVRLTRDMIAGNFATKLDNLRITNKTINNEVRHELTKEVYGNPDCAVPATGVGLLNTAINVANGRAAAGKPAAAVPSGPPVRRDEADKPRGPGTGAFGSDQPIRGVRAIEASIDRSGESALAALNLN